MPEEASDRRSVRVRLEGHVQGVGFRYWTERAATDLGLDGWVRNRRDGGVEAVFAGDADAVARMIERCHQGPPSARVDFVKVMAEGQAPQPGFEVRPTV